MKTKLFLIAAVVLLVRPISAFALACVPIQIPVAIPVNSPWALITLLVLVSAITFRLFRARRY